MARQLGPIVKYGNGPQKGQPVGPDIESWFQKDQNAGRPGIVAQWAAVHPVVAQNWVKADPLNTAYVADWLKTHPTAAVAWVKANPHLTQPKPQDLAVPFFAGYSRAHSGTFPSVVEYKTLDGKVARRIEPVREGADVQAAFFDMWLQEHKDADLERVPADMVMASGSGLDPDITLDNALWQLDRVAAAWAKKTGNRQARGAGQNRAVASRQEPCPLERPCRCAAGKRVGDEHRPAQLLTHAHTHSRAPVLFGTIPRSQQTSCAINLRRGGLIPGRWTRGRPINLTVFGCAVRLVQHA